jgi:Fe-S-cluster-containing dehydrogenase component
MAEVSGKALIIDYKYCTGCHTCELACQMEHEFSKDEWGIKVTEIGPAKFEAGWEWDYVPVPSILCDMCADRVAEGKKPTCVHHCQAKCIEMVPIEDVGKRMVELGARTSCFMPVE